ncbi:hypothetical protein ACIBCN_06350 [Nocardia sp. NPDC051052]|uniref:hypothetical protein n=1 Tax=Nocardia sp. NPDC051052 TaxID=3364322 RepID=UPI0037936E51
MPQEIGARICRMQTSRTHTQVRVHSPEAAALVAHDVTGMWLTDQHRIVSLSRKRNRAA